MEIGDDVSLFVPDKSRSGSLGGFKKIERPGVPLNRRVRDKDHGLRGPLEHGHGGPFIHA